MKAKLFALVLALQAAWMVGTIFRQERILAQGELIWLETVPVDPRDLLRGDYVILRYQLNEIPFSRFSPELTQRPPDGQSVYVVLEKRGTFHEVVQAFTHAPALSRDQVLLQGRIVPPGWRGNGATSVSVEYGLERYYIPEGTGNPRGKVTVQVAVPASGQALIKQVQVDGKPYREAAAQSSP